MYAAVSKKEKRYVGFHEDISVVDGFIRGMSHPDHFELVKIKKKVYKKICNTDELYIVDYHGKYMPYKYLESASYFLDSWEYEERMIVGHLEWLCETDPDLSKKDLKAIERVVYILRQKMEESKKDGLDLDILKDMKCDYDSYQGSIHY